LRGGNFSERILMKKRVADKRRASARQLAEMTGRTRQAVEKSLKRHRVERASDGTYDLAAALAALATGAARDKAKLAAKGCADGDGLTLSQRKTAKQIERLNVDIKIAEAKLAEIKGLLVPVDQHRTVILDMQALLLWWWDQATEAIATKRKDARLMDELREAREIAQSKLTNLIETTDPTQRTTQ
jgi:predicted  nucleic acid-binding Zn-ribbon protein